MSPLPRTPNSARVVRSAIRRRTPSVPTPSPVLAHDEWKTDDWSTRAAFYFLMGSLLLALVVFIILPFTI